MNTMFIHEIFLVGTVFDVEPDPWFTPPTEPFFDLPVPTNIPRSKEIATKHRFLPPCPEINIFIFKVSLWRGKIHWRKPTHSQFWSIFHPSNIYVCINT